MADATPLFDRRAVRLHRDRAASRVHRVAPILDELAGRLLERLDDVRRTFSCALDLGGRGAIAPRLRARGLAVVSCDLSPAMARRAGGLPVGADEAWLPFAPASFDLIVASASLHWVDDLPGCLVQLRRALRPDGLLLASLPIRGTLDPLRRGLAGAEAALRGGAAPRVSPFPTLRDCADLLQRAGFALPVVDTETIELGYAEPLALARDLRDAGETNATVARERRFAPRSLLPMALAGLPRDADGRLPVTLRMAMLTAWAPAPSQPRALKPGSARRSLAEVLADPPPDMPTDPPPEGNAG